MLQGVARISLKDFQVNPEKILGALGLTLGFIGLESFNGFCSSPQSYRV